jgi:penicillin-insensitive murein DD-endopeptidase
MWCDRAAIMGNPNDDYAFSLEDDKCPDPLRPRPTQDSRGFFMLPQAPMDSGYYVYGELYKKPARGAYQYAHPIMMVAILRVALQWQAIDKRRIGIGDISLAGGIQTPDHASHKNGLQVDIRPLRTDGREDPVCWWDAKYDRDSTARLIELFRTFAPVTGVLFNDSSIPFVRNAKRHDNHFHVELRG